MSQMTGVEMGLDAANTSVCATERFAATMPICLEEVLATMFFADIIGSEEGTGTPDSTVLSMEVSFRGSEAPEYPRGLQGALRVALPEELAMTLATDFSGSEGTVDRRTVEHVVGELANMICGSTLSRIAPDAEVVLAHPEPVDEPTLAGGRVRQFELFDGTLIVSFRLDE